MLDRSSAHPLYAFTTMPQMPSIAQLAEWDSATRIAQAHRIAAYHRPDRPSVYFRWGFIPWLQDQVCLACRNQWACDAIRWSTSVRAEVPVAWQY